MGNLMCMGENLGAVIEDNCALADSFRTMIKESSDFELITNDGGNMMNIVLYRYVGREGKARLVQVQGQEQNEINDQLSYLCAQIQKHQSEAGKTFVSRTTVPVDGYAGHSL